MSRVDFEGHDDVVVRPRGAQSGVRARTTRGAARDEFPDALLASGVTVDKEYDVETAAVRRGGTPPSVDFKVTAAPGELYVAAVRHASGAISFHAPGAQVIRTGARRGKRAASAANEFRFHIVVAGQDFGVRRGVIGKMVRLFLLKIVNAVAEQLLPALAAVWERRAFKKADITEGFVKVTQDGLTQRRLRRTQPMPVATPSGRALLLIHGTFSDTANSFRHLAATDFFARARARYGDQVFGFEHFTLSKTPEQNARDLLAGLSKKVAFDVATYSRGGLVLRNLVERADAFDDGGAKFELAHAVLVASPNQGTPLATPDRWQNTVGWIATLLDHVPDNPFTTAASFVADAVVWIAKSAGGSIPGLAAMNASDDLVGQLQASQSQAPKYSALVANHVPDAGLLQKMADVGVDAFFGQANDLVVPTEGGWRVDVDGEQEGIIPPDRVGCMGPGGNISSVPTGAHHLNFFGRRETVDFLFRAFEGKAQPYPKLDLARALPNGLRRGGARLAQPFVPPSPHDGSTPELPPPAKVERGRSAGPETPEVYSDALHITIVPPPEFVPDDEVEADADEQPKAGKAKEKPKSQSALIVASYAGGRVISPLGLQGGAAGRRWQQLIAHERTIKAFISGQHGARMPSDPEMIEYGRLLFETLFPKNVRRLYDIARARVESGRLSVVFTSAIPWVQQVPWEFAWDPAMQSFLVTEELEFVRNPLIAEPADVIRKDSERLRMLIVVAQPIDQALLSTEEEERRIRAGFAELLRNDLVDITILHQATPETLHDIVRQASFDIVHFIGHGEYDETTDKGYLLFESAGRASQRVSARSVKEILTGREIRLVFLNACDTGRDRGGVVTDFNRGVAQALMSSGIHSVIANQYAVSDIAAVGFAQYFYLGLARGESVGCAAREARIAVNYSMVGENIDWAVPVVYARDPKARFARVRSGRVNLIQPAVHSTAVHRAAAPPDGKLTVAVWDMESSFSRLDEVLDRLNSVQQVFEFERVDLGAPLGSKQRGSGLDMQIYANAVAHRLQRARRELNADYLICITPHLIMYDRGDGKREWDNYIWWPDKLKDQGNYAIVSNGVPNLPRTGPDAQRAVANMLATALIGAGSGLDSHDRGSKTCPLYYNNKTSVDLMKAKQRLDPVCRDKVRLKMPRELPGIELILRAFDGA